MAHVAILLAYLAMAWGLAAVALRLAARLPAPGDRRAVHQLALFAPLLAVGVAGGWSAQMALAGCPKFTTADRIGTIVFLAGLAGVLGAAALRESLAISRTRRRLEAIADVESEIALRLPALAGVMGVAAPQVRILATERPIACVAGFIRPTLYVSRGMVSMLSERELDGLLAHELAHLRHHDNLLAWLDVILLRTFRFLPPLQAAWAASLAEREEFADAVAAQATRRPRALASALLKLAAASAGPQDALVGAASFADPPTLVERRVERLLAMRTVGGRAWGLPAVGAFLVAAALPLLTVWALGAYTTCLFEAPSSSDAAIMTDGM